MKGGKLRVFECGEKRPEFIQERPFFGLLPEGQTSYIEPGLNGENCTVSVGEPPKDYILDTENHRFFKQIEERFRNVRPDMTLFVIDPDVVMGRYATDDEPDRSIGKSLYLHIVEKLKEANVYGKTPIDKSYVEPVIASAITSSNAFSATNPVGVTKKNLDGERNISLVVGDNPDTLVDDMFYWVPGVKERMEKKALPAVSFNSSRCTTNSDTRWIPHIKAALNASSPKTTSMLSWLATARNVLPTLMPFCSWLAITDRPTFPFDR